MFPKFEGDVSSGVPTSENPPLHARRVVANRYEILSKLGEGGTGEVWHAYDLKLRMDVALKSLRLDVKQNQDPAEALRQEVRSAREVISSNACRIFDLVVEEDQELISMEYIDGTTLLAMLLQKGALELREARDIAAQFLAGLEAIHQAGLVHRDLKPENIMITRAGRVVVMDFGIAKQVTKLSGTISGTLPYMAPEQISGEKIDARSDVFSAGVVLAEMIHPEGILSSKTREGIWNVVRQNPMQLAEGPWKAVITRAVAIHPEERFSSAGALSRALEEATQRVERVEERKPYPGLASFMATDAEYFFGREMEAETVIKKLQQLHLMAIVGASGAGKTSFLRAGLIPVLPAGWDFVFCVPGDSPVSNLVEALVPEIPEDTELMKKRLRLDNPNVLELLNRWRSKHTEVVLIIDRFEELFTLNEPEVQSRFAELVAGAAMVSNVRVLLSMRDDFLLRCNEHASLTPIFSELTPLGALTGSALRRALVQPALMCGYRYEDETLVDEMLSDVEKERGALPLMAFAASRLWEKRDRQTGQLTRAAYKDIGGVAGALTQHAETTMEQLGAERQPIVREIFRNLVTAQNTRAARDIEELLSVFPERHTAQEVLRTLIDARLLTSFEAPITQDEKPRRRVEIIHESLISAWPRLVRWQTQDADSAQLRDQLRQASQLWEQRGRSEDLLWTRTAFLEFQAWLQRYPGGLTTNEEAFGQAMVRHANKRRRQRRIAVAAIFVVLLSALAVISKFWHEATIARDDAVTATKRAEASKILAVGRAIPGADPSTKLAYALASLEFTDTPEGRRFALQALSEGPPARAIQMQSLHAIDFSPDAKWIAAVVGDGVELFPQDGSNPLVVEKPNSSNKYIQWAPQFSPDSNLVIWTSRKEPNIIKVWSLAQKQIVRTFHFEGLTRCFVRGGRAFLITDTSGRLQTPFNWGQAVIRIWNFDRGDPEMIGRFNFGGIYWRRIDIDSRAHWIGYTKGQGIYARLLDSNGIGPERLVGLHTAETADIAFRPGSDEVISSDANGEIRLWSLVPAAKNPIRVFAGTRGAKLWFDAKGKFLFSAELQWDLDSPDADPLRFPHLEQGDEAFDLEGRWMAIAGGSTLAFYPLTDNYPYIYSGKTSNVRFTPDGKSIVSGFSDDSGLDGIRIWNSPDEKQIRPQTLWSSKIESARSIDMDPLGRYVLANEGLTGVHLLSIADGKDIPLKGKQADGDYGAVAFSPDGKSAAAAWNSNSIEIWNLQSGVSMVLEQSQGIYFPSLKFSPDGDLFSGDMKGNLYRWNFHDRTRQILGIGKGKVISITISNNSRYLAASMQSPPSELVLYDLQQHKSFPIFSHGNRVLSVAFHPAGSRLITGDADGILRIGSITGEAPHLLLGNEGGVDDIAVDPSGHWIASMSGSGLRLWRMPEGKPLDSLPYDEFLNRLRALTNVRAVEDKISPSGYRTQYAHFSGWEKTPNW